MKDFILGNLNNILYQNFYSDANRKYNVDFDKLFDGGNPQNEPAPQKSQEYQNTVPPKNKSQIILIN